MIWVQPCRLMLLAALLLVGSSCSRHEHADMVAGSEHGHEHHAPHGGTPVVLGDEAYHLELVFDSDRGVLRAYVLDGHLENFVRSDALSFEIVAEAEGETRSLIFTAVDDPATGETPGDTACFEATAEWLHSERTFKGVLTSLTIRGTTFSEVAVQFPEPDDVH